MSFYFFESRRRNTTFKCDWSSDVCSSDLLRSFSAAACRGSPAETDRLTAGAFGPTPCHLAVTCGSSRFDPQVAHPDPPITGNGRAEPPYCSGMSPLDVLAGPDFPMAHTED